MQMVDITPLSVVSSAVFCSTCSRSLHRECVHASGSWCIRQGARRGSTAPRPRARRLVHGGPASGVALQPPTRAPSPAPDSDQNDEEARPPPVLSRPQAPAAEPQVRLANGKYETLRPCLPSLARRPSAAVRGCRPALGHCTYKRPRSSPAAWTLRPRRGAWARPTRASGASRQGPARGGHRHGP